MYKNYLKGKLNKIALKTDVEENILHFNIMYVCIILTM